MELDKVQSFQFRNNNFDLIRLIAALQVCVVHGYEHFNLEGADAFIDIIKIFPGVPIFFVVSGFLISASFERSKGIYSYIENRLLRIYPALWCCFFISFLSVIIFTRLDVDFSDLIAWGIAQLSFAQFYNPDFLRGYGVGVLNGSLWTIPVELQFYFILPFLYLLFDKLKWNRFSLIALMSLCVLINVFFLYCRETTDTNMFKLFGVSVFPYLYVFLFGMILQRNIRFVEKYLFNRAPVFLLLYLLFAYIGKQLELSYHGNYLNPFLALSLAIFVISVAYTKPEKYSSILNGNDISYGVYIYHMVIVNALLEVSNLNPSVNFLLMVMLTIVFAGLSWVFVERPALSFKKTTLKRVN